MRRRFIVSSAGALFVTALAAGMLGSARSASPSGTTTIDRAVKVSPITDAMLATPNPADWINWRRTLDGWGYSPLTQINTRNVRGLKLVWSWALEPGPAQTTPLVH